MKKILIVESVDAYRSILKFNLLNTMGSEVIEKTTLKSALEYVDLNTDIDLIICRDKEDVNFKKYLIPLLVTHSYHDWENTIKIAGGIFDIDIDFSKNNSIGEYLEVGINYFEMTASLCVGCDVFVKVKKENNYQFVKCLHAQESFTKDDVEKYKIKGLKNFYIPKEQFSQYVNAITKILIKKLAGEGLTDPQRIYLTAEAYDLSAERIRILGIDENTVEVVTHVLTSIKNSLGKNNSLSIFLETIHKNKVSLAYSRAYLCSLLLSKVVKTLNWQSSQIIEKLVFLAYFHDISLKGELMKYDNQIDLQRSFLSEEEKIMIINHASLSATIVDHFPNIPNGIASVIKEHHGSKNGIGFPEHLDVNISPLAMMFIVVENFVNNFLNIKGIPERSDLEKIFVTLGAKYNTHTYERTLVALEGIILI